MLSLQRWSKAPIKKNDYKSVIDIPFISDIVSHLVAFRYLIKVMADVENIWNNDDFFGDTVDTPKEDIGQHRKRECLMSAIGSGKVYLLESKWTQEKVEKVSDETINKTYAEYRQR